jgi:hypothetical protein
MWLSKATIASREGTLRVKGYQVVFLLGDHLRRRGMVGHVGAALLVEVASTATAAGASAGRRGSGRWTQQGSSDGDGRCGSRISWLGRHAGPPCKRRNNPAKPPQSPPASGVIHASARLGCVGKQRSCVGGGDPVAVALGGPPALSDQQVVDGQ